MWSAGKVMFLAENRAPDFVRGQALACIERAAGSRYCPAIRTVR